MARANRPCADPCDVSPTSYLPGPDGNETLSRGKVEAVPTSESIEIEVKAALPPLKNEAKSILSQGHPHAPRGRALLEAALAARMRDSFEGFGRRRIGMDVTVRPGGAVVGDATNALGGIGDTLQARRSNIDLTYLGKLGDAFLYDDDTQIREVRYREERGEQGYIVRLWVL
jgi:hypothetical protein